MVPKNGTNRHNGASQQVLTYLREHANTAIPYPEIHKAIGATDKFTVPNAVTHLIARGMPLERVMRGMVLYRTMPQVGFPSETKPEPIPETPTQKLYEFVGNSGGVTIVKGEDDELYVVTPLVEFVTRQP